MSAYDSMMEEEIQSLRAENAAQALLIASLKEENESLVKQLDQNWVQHQEIVRAREQLSDTQRQNAELMQRVGEAEKDAERYHYLRDQLIAADFDYQDSGECVLIFGWPRAVPVGGNCDINIDAAIAASKVSNEVASKGDGND